MNVVMEAQHAMTSLQLGIWERFQPPADPGQSPGGGPGREAPLRGSRWGSKSRRSYNLHQPKIHLRGSFTLNYNVLYFVDYGHEE